MNDLEKWANSSNDEIYEIAKNIWSKKFTTSQLRGFQIHYQESMTKIDGVNWKGLNNMLKCADYSISIREFGY